MEKIKINETIFDITPMGITNNQKQRTFIISSNLTYTEIEQAFLTVDRIEYISESDEVLAIYLDGIALKSISKDFETGLYTVVISTDVVERQIKELQEQVKALMGE